jgi:hypothetical protein
MWPVGWGGTGGRYCSCMGVTGEERLLFARGMSFFLYVNRRYTGDIICSVNVLIVIVCVICYIRVRECGYWGIYLGCCGIYFVYRVCVGYGFFYVYDVNRV